jgi:branched-chain amino acid transport system permease protein
LITKAAGTPAICSSGNRNRSIKSDMDIVIIGLLLGGTYALMAMGLQLQYGVARIMNLANGEVLIAGAFGAFWFFLGTKASPLWSLLFVVPCAFGLNWAIYRVLIVPLVRRSKSQGKLEVDSILATFGLSFFFIGIMVAAFGAQYTDYSYLSEPVFIFGQRYGLNRVVSFGASVLLCAALYLWLHKTRAGLALRAVSVNPSAAGLVSINVINASALAFALGGAVTAAGGVLLSMYLTFDASYGVVFTLKALIIVILGGVGDIRGTIVAAFVLGLAETAVATLIDPGLTLAAAYVLFMLVLLVRPQGLFGRRVA